MRVANDTLIGCDVEMGVPCRLRVGGPGLSREILPGLGLTARADSACGSVVQSERRTSADTANSHRSCLLGRALQKYAAGACWPVQIL